MPLAKAVPWNSNETTAEVAASLASKKPGYLPHYHAIEIPRYIGNSKSMLKHPHTHTKTHNEQTSNEDDRISVLEIPATTSMQLLPKYMPVCCI